MNEFEIGDLLDPDEDGLVLAEASLLALDDEVGRARDKFPSNRLLLTALAEELGELAEAYLEWQGLEGVRMEALQVACVAMRIYEEGDSVYDAAYDGSKRDRLLFTLLAKEFGALGKAFLQRKNDAIREHASEVARRATQIAEHGDTTYDDVTDAEAKP